MTESSDRSQRRPPALGRGRGFSGAVRDELAKLRGKRLGDCAGCGKPVFSQESFTRSAGRILHVRCPIATASALERYGTARARDIAGQEHDLATPARYRAPAIAEQQRTDTDDVSGALARAAGLVALAREVDRAHRSDSALTVVYVDAGDANLCDVAGALLGSMRSYDLVIAVSVDAFVCALCGATISTALARLGAIEQGLAAAGVQVTVGYAELAASDTPGTLIDGAAADAPSTRPRIDHDSTPARSLRAVSANANGRGPR